MTKFLKEKKVPKKVAHCAKRFMVQVKNKMKIVLFVTLYFNISINAKINFETCAPLQIDFHPVITLK